MLSSLLTLTIGFIHGQENKSTINEQEKIGQASNSVQFQTACIGERNEPSTDLKWRQILTHKIVAFEPQSPDYEKIKELKAAKLILKQQAKNNTAQSENSTNSVIPEVGPNFLGNTNNGSSPMDNSIAISNGGWIVSVANTTIEYDDMNGNNFYFNDIVSFIGDNQITNVCDPVVIYDPGADRFIFFAQECAGNSSNSYLLVFFSKSNNPIDGWWYYRLTGNPLTNNSWFDYPKLAVSTNELYITGNLFSDSGTFSEAILYQIDKYDGYSGSPLTWQYWFDISGSPFTLCPVSHGQNSTYGPGCYLVATSAVGASTINLYDLTDDMSGNPSLIHYSIPTTSYSPAADSYQLGTSTLLDNGDCRTLGGFYLNGVIHFVFHSDRDNGWNGINYNRLTVSSQSNVSNTFGLSDYDYSYPSVVSFSNSSTDKSVMIGFGRASSSIYPEIRVVNCDNNANWSSSVLVKSSSSYVSYSSTTEERWGDYTGTTRNHNSSNPSIWMSGMYGTSNNVWNTWISEIHAGPVGIIEQTNNKNNVKIYPNPVIETFNIEFELTERTDLNIQIVDVNGKYVKQLFSGFGQGGTNVFSFNKSNLQIGVYFLIITSSNKTIVNEKIIISN